jgi:hypothetical protein
VTKISSSVSLQRIVLDLYENEICASSAFMNVASSL